MQRLLEADDHIPSAKWEEDEEPMRAITCNTGGFVEAVVAVDVGRDTLCGRVGRSDTVPFPYHTTDTAGQDTHRPSVECAEDGRKEIGPFCRKWRHC